MISFVVYGKPEPAGSKRAFKHPSTGRIMVTDANAKSKPWKQQVAGAALDAMGGRGPLNGPVKLTVTFVLPRPKNHYRTGRNRHLLRDSAPLFPTSRPDATKLLRGVEDALTGIVWRDDAHVVDQTALKRYGDPPACYVSVSELPATPRAAHASTGRAA